MSTAPKGAALALVGRGRQHRPVPMIVKVTPALAEKILTANTFNRTLKAGRVERYARDMKAGRWRLNAETIKITTNGDLLDGQHRLFAVIEAGVPIEMMIVEGLDPEVMPTIDTGAPRTMGDVLTIQGGKNTNVTASALRWLVWFHTKPLTMSGPLRTQVTHQELLDAMPLYPTLGERVSEVVSRGKIGKFMPTSLMVFVYYEAYKIDPAKAGAFTMMLDTGVIDDAGNPVHTLREKLIQNRAARSKMPQLEVAALTVKAWNAFLRGRRLKIMRWVPDSEGFPAFEKARR